MKSVRSLLGESLLVQEGIRHALGLLSSGVEPGVSDQKKSSVELVEMRMNRTTRPKEFPMNRMFALVAISLLMGCGGNVSTITGLNDLELDASSVVDADVLATEVRLHNHDTSEIVLTVLHHCPVYHRLSRPGSGGPPVFDGGELPCTRAGREVRIEPGGSAQLRREVRLDVLREHGIGSGEYEVIAVVTSGPEPMEVAAGRVVIP